MYIRNGAGKEDYFLFLPSATSYILALAAINRGQRIDSTKNMETIKHILTDNLVILIIGLSFVTIGIIVPKFKLYWLIAGLNGLSKKELERFNLRYIEKYFGTFMLILGLLTIINPFLWTAMQRQGNILPTFLVVTVGTIILMFIIGGINRRKIYNS